MNNLLDRIEKRIANRDTIAATFGTDSITTHNILQNLNFNFIRQFLANNDTEAAQRLWNEAHPFKYPSHDSRDYFSFDLEFIKKYLNVFGTKSFWTGGGWGEYDPVKGIVPWVYTSGYRDVPLIILPEGRRSVR